MIRPKSKTFVPTNSRLPVYRVFYHEVRSASKVPHCWEQLKKAIGENQVIKWIGWKVNSGKRTIYRACALVPKREERKILLPQMVIPGGDFVGGVLEDWIEEPDLVQKTQDWLLQNYKLDDDRPFLEFYQPNGNMEVWMPVFLGNSRGL